MVSQSCPLMLTLFSTPLPEMSAMVRFRRFRKIKKCYQYNLIIVSIPVARNFCGERGGEEDKNL